MPVEPTESLIERIRARAEAYHRKWPLGRRTHEPLAVAVFPGSGDTGVHIRVDWLSQTRNYAVELVCPVLESHEIEGKHYQVIGEHVLQVRNCSSQRVLARVPPDFLGQADLAWAIKLAVQDSKAAHGR